MLVSLLSLVNYSVVPPTPAFYQPYIGLVMLLVVNHNRTCSALPTAACDVLVATVPTTASGVSKPLCCRLTLTFTQTSVNLSPYTFYWSWYNYAAQLRDILNPPTFARGVENHAWVLYWHCCYRICICIYQQRKFWSDLYCYFVYTCSMLLYIIFK